MYSDGIRVSGEQRGMTINNRYAKDEMERNYGVYKTDLPKNSGFLAIPNFEKIKRFLPPIYFT
jgi:hypothetical protein